LGPIGLISSIQVGRSALSPISVVRSRVSNMSHVLETLGQIGNRIPGFLLVACCLLLRCWLRSAAAGRCYRSLALGDSLTSLMADHPHSRNVDLYM
jgi:hypothetical protein